MSCGFKGDVEGDEVLGLEEGIGFEDMCFLFRK